MRKLFTLLPFAAIVAGVFLALFVPSQKVEACLPCFCDFNPTLNCYGRYAVYTLVDSAQECRIEIATINENGYDDLAISLSSMEIAALPDRPEEHLLIDQYYDLAFYKLSSGEFQINYGPNVEGKVFVLIFSDCPAENVYETSYIPGQ